MIGASFSDDYIPYIMEKPQKVPKQKAYNRR